jgi:hypothetical protein
MSPIPAPEAVTDPALLAAVEFARAAAQAQAGAEVGAHVAAQAEDTSAVTHLFDAAKPGYHGWRWAVTVSHAGTGTAVTVSEVVLLPGPDALIAPPWVPWQERVQAGDLGVGDLLPTDPDDVRLQPAYIGSDDPAVEAIALEIGLGRPRVLSRIGRLDAADRWHDSEFGPTADMARSAPAHCGTCGFYLRVEGSLGAAFGVCGNELAPADGRVVHAEYGCGAHSEAEVEQISPVLVADLIYDDATLDYEPMVRAARPVVTPEPDSVDDAVAPDSDEIPVAVGEDAAVVEKAATVGDLPAEGDWKSGPDSDIPDSDIADRAASYTNGVHPTPHALDDAATADQSPQASGETGGEGAVEQTSLSGDTAPSSAYESELVITSDESDPVG